MADVFNNHSKQQTFHRKTISLYIPGKMTQE